MSSEIIHCLIYRYYRIKERICAVKIKDSQYVTLEEMEYKAEKEFFLNSDFSGFLESTSYSFDLCIIYQGDDRGKDFRDLFQTFYNTADSSSIWTEEKIQEALQSLNLKKSLRIGNISVEGKDSRFDYASIFSEKETKNNFPDIQDSNGDKVDDLTNEESGLFERADNEDKSDSSEAECSKIKSSLCLAMDKIISENYKNK